MNSPLYICSHPPDRTAEGRRQAIPHQTAIKLKVKYSEYSVLVAATNGSIPVTIHLRHSARYSAHASWDNGGGALAIAKHHDFDCLRRLVQQMALPAARLSQLGAFPPSFCPKVFLKAGLFRRFGNLGSRSAPITTQTSTLFQALPFRCKNGREAPPLRASAWPQRP